MKKIKIDRRAAKVLGFAVVAALSSSVHATNFTWDSSGSSSSSPQDGSGTWSTTNLNWTSTGSGSDVGWTSLTSSNAFIGSDNNTVSGVLDITMGAGGVTLGNITFGTLKGGSSTTYYDIVGTSANTLGMTGSTPTVTVNSGVYAEIDAAIVVTGSQPDLTVAGSGTLYMNPTVEGSNYHGLIFAGTSTTVLLSTAAVPIAIPNNTTAANFDGGTLTFAATPSTDISGRITETSSSPINIGVVGGALVTFGSPLGGSGGLNVSGSGSGSTLELSEGSGSQVGFSGSGGVNITGGTLYLAGTHNTELGSNTVTVGASGTLSGTTEFVTTGTTTVNGTVTGGSGAISGDSYGNLKLSATNLNSGGTYVFKLNQSVNSYKTGTTVNSITNFAGDMDALEMSSLTFNATSSSPFNISLVSGGSFGLTAGTTYKFAIANVANGTSSTFNSTVLGELSYSGFTLSEVADSSLSSANNGSSNAELDTGSGEDLILSYTPTPEPTSFLLGGLAISPLMLARRRRRLALVCDA